MWNHAAFKSLLFFGAGSVLHATGTRDMERMGGLAARMPRTALAIFPGVLAVSALPPFNGFVSEWLLYRGFFAASLGGGAWTEGLALTALAITGGLAGVAFAKFFGFVFLGVARSPEAEAAHDPGPAMWGPMLVLAGLCMALSLGSALLLPLLDRVVAIVSPGPGPLLAQGLDRELWLFAGMAAMLLGLGAGALFWLRRPAPAPDRPGTWDCGYAAPTARMQYSASSFADGWGESMPGLKSRVRRVKGLFPRSVGFHSRFQDPVGEGFVAPRTARLVERLQRYRGLQQGLLPMYLLYILVTLVGMFLWLVLRDRLLG